MRIFSTHSSKSKYLKCTAKICVELRSYEHIISFTLALASRAASASAAIAL